MENMGRNYKNKECMVFCIIYCDDAKPYTNYNTYTKSRSQQIREKANERTSLVLAQMRDDGMLGFPGGHVKRNQSILSALKSELREEINMYNLDETRLEKLYTSINMRRQIIAYAYKVSYEELKEIFLRSNMAEHSICENCGTILLNINKKNIDNIMGHKYAGSSKEDLKILVNKYKLLKIR